MKIRIILKIVVLVCALPSLAFTQATSPAPVDLSYHFKPGTTLHYQRLDEIRNPENPPGYMEGNFDTKDDIHITVEKVDSLGNATLVIQNEETHDFKGGDDASGVTMGALAQNIPLYRVTVDPYGKYLSGKILRYSPQDSLERVRLKDPNYFVSPRSDSANINFWMDQALCVRPARNGVRVGTKWNDSLCKISPRHLIPSRFAGTPSTVPPPAGLDYNAYRYDYTVDQDAVTRNAGQYQLGVETIFYQVFDGKLMAQCLTDEKQVVRSFDGLTVSRSEMMKRTGGSAGVDTYSIKRTLTLISVDSTAH